MPRPARTVALAALALPALLVPAPAAADHLPHPDLLDRSPVTLRGTDFVARQSVRVTFHIGSRVVVRRDTTSRRGRFLVVVAGLRADRCGRRLTVRVRGSRGDRAFFTRTEAPCAEPDAGPPRSPSGR